MKGRCMTGLPTSLAIAVWLVGSIWLVAIAGRVLGAPDEIVDITFGAGVIAAVTEWAAIKGRGR
jgi:hypothetical protein